MVLIVNTNCKGYCYCKRNQKWYARIKINGKTKSLGYFPLKKSTPRNIHTEYVI